MRQKWKKLGRILEPRPVDSSFQSHAALPVADRIDGSVYRIFFSPRDAQNRSHCHYVVIDLEDSCKILEQSEAPVLSPGFTGFFDDCGVLATYVVNLNGRRLMYYEGFNRTTTEVFRIAVGLATSSDGKTYTRLSNGPILDRSPHDPCLIGSLSVLIENNLWRMWYVSGVEWRERSGKLQHRYHIKYAESVDGINWQRDGLVAIDFKDDDEYAIVTPRIIKENGIYKMWYCYRGDVYRIGYAESPDGLQWTRMDDLSGIDVSDSGWDSEMICYPFVFDHGGDRYMLYNGNRYGLTGFGIAVLER